MIGVFFFVKFSNQTNVADVCCVDYSAIFTNNLSSIRNNCYFYFFRMEKKECCICNNLTGSCILSGFKKSLAKCDGVLLVSERISTTFECVRVFASAIVFYAYTSRNFSAPGLCTVIRKIRWIKLWFDSKMKISTNKRWKKNKTNQVTQMFSIDRKYMVQCFSVNHVGKMKLWNWMFVVQSIDHCTYNKLYANG